VEESLKTVNLIHQIIVGISAAIFAFSLTNDPTPRYTAALDQLTAFRRFSLNDFDEYAHSLLIAKDRELAAKYRPILSRITRIKLSDDFSVNQPIYIQRPLADAPMVEIFKFIDGESKIAYPRLDDTEFTASTLDTAIAENKTCEIPADFQLSLVTLDMGQPAGPTDLKSWTNPEQKSSDVVLIFSKRIDAISSASCLRYAKIKSNPEFIPGNHAVEWISSKNSGRMLVLRDLRAISGQIASMSPSEASKYLEQKADAPKPPLEFLGIAVEQKTAVLAGPLITLLLLLYFMSQVRHLGLGRHASDSVFTTFPWVGLFPDRVSKVLTYSSVVLFPVISNVCLLRRGIWRDTATATGWVLAGATLFVALLTAREIRRVREWAFTLHQTTKTPHKIGVT
jgi:hypothetical protein